MYTCTITFEGKGDLKSLERLFSSEKPLETDRANYTMERDSKGIHFKISAKDAVALRAAANGIMKTLAVFEKVKEVE